MCVFDIKQMKKILQKEKRHFLLHNIRAYKISGQALSQIDHSLVSEIQTHGHGRVVRVSYFNSLLTLREEPW